MPMANSRLSIRGRSIGFLTLCVVVLLACGSDGPSGPPAVADIVVDPAQVTLAQGQMVTLQATAVDAGGQRVRGVVIGYEPVDPNLISVSSNGSISSIGAAGSTAVRLTAEDVTKTVPVVVTAVAGFVHVLPNPALVPQLGTLQLTARVLDVHGNEFPSQEVTYVGLDESRVSVTPEGFVTSKGPHGNAEILVEFSSQIRTTIQITVVQEPIALRVVPTATWLRSLGSLQLRVELIDLLGVVIEDNHPISFESSNDAVVTVDANGMVTAVGPLGDASIEVQFNEMSRSVSLTVLPALDPGALLQGHVDRTIEVPDAFGVAFSSSGLAYAVSLSNGLYQLDLATGSATRISAHAGGSNLVLSPDGSKAYVSDLVNGQVHLVELGSGQILASAAMTDGERPFTVYLGDALWVGGARGVEVFDPATLTLQSRIPGGPVAHLAPHPTQPIIYASGSLRGVSGQVYEINTNSRQIQREFRGLGYPQGVAVSPGGHALYVADESGKVHVLDLATGERSATIDLPEGPYGLTLAQDGTGLYVAMSAGGALAIIDAVTGEVISTKSLGALLRRVVLSPDGSMLLVASESPGRVSIIR